MASIELHVSRRRPEAARWSSAHAWGACVHEDVRSPRLPLRVPADVVAVAFSVVLLLAAAGFQPAPLKASPQGHTNFKDSGYRRANSAAGWLQAACMLRPRVVARNAVVQPPRQDQPARAPDAH